MIDFVAGFLPTGHTLITLATMAGVLTALSLPGRGIAGWRVVDPAEGYLADGAIAPEIALARGCGGAALLLTAIGVAAGLIGLPDSFALGAGALALPALGVLSRRLGARDVRTAVPLLTPFFAITRLLLLNALLIVVAGSAAAFFPAWSWGRRGWRAGVWFCRVWRDGQAAGWSVMRRWDYPPIRLQLAPGREPFEAHGCDDADRRDVAAPGDRG